MPTKGAMIAIGAIAIGGAVAFLAGTSNAANENGKPPPKPKPEPATGGSAKPPAAGKPAAPAPASPPAVPTVFELPKSELPKPSAPTAAGLPPSAPPVQPNATPAPAGPAVTVPTSFPTNYPGWVPPVQIQPNNPTQLANELALHLATLQVATGGPKGAKGKENRVLVKTAQKAFGLTDDGEAGPATFLGMARRMTAGEVPLVMYWPKKGDAKTVQTYRAALLAIAAQAPEPLKSSFIAAAKRERGQGGINGPLAPVDPPVAAG